MSSVCHLIDVPPLEQKVCGHLERCWVIGVHLQRPLAELLCELELALVQQIRRLAQQLLQAVLGLLPLPSLLLVRLGALLGLRLAHALMEREAETRLEMLENLGVSQKHPKMLMMIDILVGKTNCEAFHL